MEWVLASGSPRRKEILLRAGHAFTVAATNADESYDPSGTPEQIASEIALRKARSASAPGKLVIGADTAVWLDDRMLGKPRDRAEAIGFLQSLSGRDHRVVTGVAVVADERTECGSASSTVTFPAFSREEIEKYVDEFRPYDKAGGYGIQELPPERVSYRGGYDTIVGLPLELTLRLIARAEAKE